MPRWPAFDLFAFLVGQRFAAIRRNRAVGRPKEQMRSLLGPPASSEVSKHGRAKRAGISSGGEVAGVVKRTRGWSWLGGSKIASLTLDHSGNKNVGYAGCLQIRVWMRLAPSFVLADCRAIVWTLSTRGEDVDPRGGGLVAQGASVHGINVG